MIHIRLLQADDVDQYHQLRLRSLQEHPDAFGSSVEEESHVQDIQWRIIATKDKWIVGAFECESLVGMVGWFRQSQIKLRHKSSIWGMYVSPEYKGQGIGRRLLKDTLLRVRELNDIEQIQLSVTTHNTAAKKLYEDMGFIKFGYEEKALKWEDYYYNEIHMVLHLS